MNAEMRRKSERRREEEEGRKGDERLTTERTERTETRGE